MPTVPITPSEFRVVSKYHDDMETTVTLDWIPPQGSGPEAVVDNYTISILPTPPYQPATVYLVLPPWNVTLDHNEEYTLNLTAINCVGESATITLTNIKFGKLMPSLKSMTR